MQDYACLKVLCVVPSAEHRRFRARHQTRQTWTLDVAVCLVIYLVVRVFGKTRLFPITPYFLALTFFSSCFSLCLLLGMNKLSMTNQLASKSSIADSLRIFTRVEWCAALLMAALIDLVAHTTRGQASFGNAKQARSRHAIPFPLKQLRVWASLRELQFNQNFALSVLPRPPLLPEF